MNKNQLKKIENVLSNVLPKVLKTIIYDDEDGNYIVYDHYIVRQESNYFMVNTLSDGIKPRRFSKIKNAIAWVILWDKHRVYEANRIEQLDTSLSALEVEKILSLRMQKKKGMDSYLIHLIKYNEAVRKQKQFTAELDKYITMANRSQLQGFENELKRTSGK